jgi:uncharacterized membrane protein
MNIIYTFLLAVPIIFVVDLLWLGLFAKNFYQAKMSPLVAIEFNWFYVVLFYLLYFTGVYLFALKPGIDALSLKKALTLAALFGFFCYMTYDLTNLATLKDWPLSLAIVDILWGVFLTTLTTFLAYKIYFWLS